MTTDIASVDTATPPPPATELHRDRPSSTDCAPASAYLPDDEAAPVDHSRAIAVRRYVLLAAAALSFVVVGWLLFRSTGQDDSYISYWPAHTLAKYGAILNYNGDRVEQSTSILWVLILGITTAITHAEVSLLGPLFSIVCGMGSIVVVSRAASRIGSRVQLWAVLLTATATYLIYWSFSGMEASLTAMCATWLVVAFRDYLSGARTRSIETSAAIACCLLVRPEMVAVLLVATAIIGGVLTIRRHRRLTSRAQAAGAFRKLGTLALQIAAISVVIACARFAYFHSVLPESGAAKGGFHPVEGIRYVIASVLPVSVLPTALLALVGICWAGVHCAVERPLNMMRLTATSMVIAYCMFVVAVGGDWMLAGRFIVHILPLALLLAADALDRLLGAMRMAYAGVALAVLQLLGTAQYARQESVGTRVSHTKSRTVSMSLFDRSDRLFLRDVRAADALDAVVRRLIANGQPVVHLFSGQMGLVMYSVASHRFRHVDITDRHGLTDRRFATCEAAVSRPRMTNGLAVEYAWYVPRCSTIAQQCDVPIPDVIYDIEPVHSRFRIDPVQKNGFATVFHRVCDSSTTSRLVPGSDIALDEFIAVRRDLLPKLRQAIAEATKAPVRSN